MNELIMHSTSDLQLMASKMAKLFGKSPDDLFALMLMAQAENKHPAIAAQEYDVIQGRPALRSQATLARFQAAGGKIQWVERTDEKVTAEFSHPQGGTLQITWTMERASKAKLTNKENWQKYPAQMLSARVIAEGVRALYPACLSGLYLVEEVQDFEPMRNVTPQPQEVQPVVVEAAQVEVKPETPRNHDFEKHEMEVKKAVAAILKAEGNPDAWTAKEKDLIGARTLVLEAREKQDGSILDALLIRAKIGALVRGTKFWDDTMKMALDLGYDIPSLEMGLKSLETQKKEGKL